ncbi:UNVERIFIED_CONTAM: hypothetical protein ABID98_005334 [Brevibacillus sp. OAP136]
MHLMYHIILKIIVLRFTNTSSSSGMDLEFPGEEVFIDPNGNPLTYTIVSSNPTIVEAYIEDELGMLDPTNHWFSLYPQADGVSTITITADNGHGQTKEETFTVTVSAIVYGIVEVETSC